MAKFQVFAKGISIDEEIRIFRKGIQLDVLKGRISEGKTKYLGGFRKGKKRLGFVKGTFGKCCEYEAS